MLQDSEDNVKKTPKVSWFERIFTWQKNNSNIRFEIKRTNCGENWKAVRQGKKGTSSEIKLLQSVPMHQNPHQWDLAVWWNWKNGNLLNSTQRMICLFCLHPLAHSVFHSTLFSKPRHRSPLTWRLLRCNTPWQRCPQTAPHRWLCRTQRVQTQTKRDQDTHLESSFLLRSTFQSRGISLWPTGCVKPDEPEPQRWNHHSRNKHTWSNGIWTLWIQLEEVFTSFCELWSLLLFFLSPSQPR